MISPGVGEQEKGLRLYRGMKYILPALLITLSIIAVLSVTAAAPEHGRNGHEDAAGEGETGGFS